MGKTMRIFAQLAFASFAAAYLACSSEPRVATKPNPPPREAPSAATVAPPEPAPDALPICEASAVALHTAQASREPWPFLRGRYLAAQAVTDEGEAVALHVIGLDPETQEGDPRTYRAEITVWDRSGAIRWIRSLGPYDPFGERTYPSEPRLLVAERAVVVAFDARGPIAVDSGDRMAPVPDAVGSRGVRHLQLAAFALPSGDVAWSRALDAFALPYQTSLRMRDGRLEIVHPVAPWMSIGDGGRGEAQTLEAGPDQLVIQLGGGIGEGPDGELWEISRQRRVSNDSRPLTAPTVLVSPTPRAGELHVCVVPCHQNTTDCGAYGRCREENGVCVVTEEGCRASRNCLSRGDCTPDAESARCIAAHDGDCQQSQTCRVEGRCVAAHQSCLARCPDGTLDTECLEARTSCQDAPECKDHGACTIQHGRCVVGSDADCRGSRACSDRGQCAYLAPFGMGHCHVPSAAACRQATACRDDGRCTLFRDDTGQGVCRVHTPADCRGSRGCRERGACTPIEGGPIEGLHCLPGSSDDCRRSALCQRDGRCRMVNGECVP
jgi:hypothetical protein